MSKQEELFLYYLNEVLKKDYGIEVFSSQRVFHGADLEAKTFQIMSSKGEKYFVKIKKKSDHFLNLQVLALLNHHLEHGIISPYKTLDGKLTSSYEEASLIVFPFVHGLNGFNQSLTQDQWKTFGQMMRQVHALELDEKLRQKMKKQMLFSSIDQKLRSLLDQIDSILLQDEISLNMIELIRQKHATFNKLLADFSYLSQQVQRLKPSYHLCHGDIHAGNVLIDDEGHLYLIDWDEMILAPKEKDLLFIGGGVGNVWNKKQEENYFYQGYGETSIDLTLLAYFRYERILQDLVAYIQALLFDYNPQEDRFKLFQEFYDQFAPLGVIDIAFHTHLNKR